MPFLSILTPHPDAAAVLDADEAADLFRDLNLDQVFEAVMSGRDEYRLEPLFRTLPADRATIAYRHEVLRDLESEPLTALLHAFEAGMRAVRISLSRTRGLYHHYQRRRWFLDATAIYCKTASELADGLRALDLGSEGFAELRDFLAGYCASEPFRSLASEAQALTTRLADVRYNVQIKGHRITVSRYEGEADYGAELEETFAKFAQGVPDEHRFTFGSSSDMGTVEVAILERVVKLHPEVFADLERFAERHAAFLDPAVAGFDREIQFYLAYLEYVAPLRGPGHAFCLPELVEDERSVLARDAFDLALAQKLRREHGHIVVNDVELCGDERILVVTGPNQGGKTTFARMVGQLEYLARLGLPVPAREARLFLFDRLFAHFERREEVENLAGKLEDDLTRIHRILERSTDRTVVILNESFSATTLDDGMLLGRRVLELVLARRVLAVYVTFLDELARLGPEIVSIASDVDADEPARRTFRFVRRPPEGLAYAAAIAEKYGVTYDDVKRRVLR